MHDKASREYKNLFDLNIELNQDESLYEYLKETATMKGGEDEQIVLNSLIVKHMSACYHQSEYEQGGMGTGRDPHCSDLMRADAELCEQYMTVYIKEFDNDSQNIQTNKDTFTVREKDFFFIPNELNQYRQISFKR